MSTIRSWALGALRKGPPTGYTRTIAGVSILIGFVLRSTGVSRRIVLIAASAVGLLAVGGWVVGVAWLMRAAPSPPRTPPRQEPG